MPLHLCFSQIECDHFDFKCALHGECVSPSKVCNGVADCEDGSDEARCALTLPSTNSTMDVSKNISELVSFFPFLYKTIIMCSCRKGNLYESCAKFFNENLCIVFACVTGQQILGVACDDVGTLNIPPHTTC